ncbi:MAG: lysophospholipid acyltransferase family protein [Tannerellaceae bacterium]|jgi:KDO2-lipid IV(A) lauroyltransferase|nr:lysophospholipid acyltransferase family protein [Tannerellaceae bacterium]
MNNILYTLLCAWVRIHAWLPFGLLYVLSDIGYVLVYKIAGYRLRVTRRNLEAAFPGKTPRERRLIERRFYRHFVDYIVETVKLAHISEAEIQRRARMTNPELIDRLVDRGHTCILILLGHYGNWEWFTAGNSFFASAVMYPIYRPLSNKAFDRLFIDLRARFGAVGIRKADTVRDLIRLKQEQTPALAVFLADQTPSLANLHYWTRFLGLETAMLTGPERLARKLNLPVVYADVRKPGRGYYEVEFKLLTDAPQQSPAFALTEAYARLMEQTILRDPAYWLWTHKRWKHKREDTPCKK